MAKENKGKYYIKDYELEQMPSYSNYPQSLLKAMHGKALIGRDGGIQIWTSLRRRSSWTRGRTTVPTRI